MAHITEGSAMGGVLSRPHCLPTGQTVTSEYYYTMLETDAFPQIGAISPEGELFWRHQDSASPHAALNTKEALAAKDLRCIPWLPAGADLSTGHLRKPRSEEAPQRRGPYREGKAHG